MSDVSYTADEPESQPAEETPDVAAETPAETPDVVEGTVDETDSQEQPVDDDDVELEVDGDKYRVPKKLESAFLRNRDYTEKTQAIAEERKVIQAEREATMQRARDQETFMEDISTVRALEANLKEYGQIDWNTLARNDPQRALELQIQHQQLREAHSNKIAELDNKVRTHVATQEQQEAAETAKTIEVLTKPDPKIGWPGYSPAHMTKLAEVAEKELGVTKADLKRIRSPQAIKILNLSLLGLQSLKTAQTARAKPVVKAQPAQQVRGIGAAVNRDPNKLPIDEWVKQERIRMAKKIQQP